MLQRAGQFWMQINKLTPCLLRSALDICSHTPLIPGSSPGDLTKIFNPTHRVEPLTHKKPPSVQRANQIERQDLYGVDG